MTRLTVNRLSRTRVVVTFARYRNRAKTRAPPTSVRIKGRKYMPSGRMT